MNDVEVGSRVILKSTPKRYHGGPATVVRAEEKAGRKGWVVRRDGYVGQGKRETWVTRSEFEIAPKLRALKDVRSWITPPQVLLRRRSRRMSHRFPAEQHRQ